MLVVAGNNVVETDAMPEIDFTALRVVDKSTGYGHAECQSACE